MDKRLIRRQTLFYRRLLRDDLFDARNRLLIRGLIQYLREDDAQSVHLFMPIRKNKEPNLSALLSEPTLEHVEFITSVVNWENKTLGHVSIDRLTKFETDRLGIPIPVEAKPFNEPDRLTHMLIPLLLVDRKGHRIGYGGGYYDKLITQTKSKSIGISLSSPVDQLMPDPWDQAVQEIMTPWGLIKATS